jgi:hypothetical protein
MLTDVSQWVERSQRLKVPLLSLVEGRAEKTRVKSRRSTAFAEATYVESQSPWCAIASVIPQAKKNGPSINSFGM